MSVGNYEWLKRYTGEAEGSNDWWVWAVLGVIVVGILMAIFMDSGPTECVARYSNGACASWEDIEEAEPSNYSGPYEY